MSENQKKKRTKTFLSLNRKRRRLDQGSSNRKKIGNLIISEDSHVCPICRSNIDAENICGNCSVIPNTPSSTKHLVKITQHFPTERVFTELPCSLTSTSSSKSTSSPINEPKNFKKLEKKSTAARKYLQKMKSQHVQVNLSYGIDKIVQVNIPIPSCTTNVSSQTVPKVMLTKSSQTIVQEKEDICVQTKAKKNI